MKVASSRFLYRKRIVWPVAGFGWVQKRRKVEEIDTICEHCFDDEYLVELIREEGSKGVCAACGARGVCVDPALLGDVFRDAIDALYAPSDSFEAGEELAFHLQDEWKIFSDRLDDTTDAQRVTLAILRAGISDKDLHTDHPDYSDLFVRRSTSLMDWWLERAYEDLRNADGKRVQEDAYDSPLVPFFEDLLDTIDQGVPLFRARIHKNRTRTDRFSLEELGAPPSSSASAGRASLAGEPVFYCATDPETALAEVRAWRGMAVAVTEFRTTKPLRLVSLVNPPTVESPFGDDLIAWRVDMAELAWNMSIGMSTPILPHEEETQYRPTQYLAAQNRAAGYDGCKYPSAMGTGTNLVLFDPDAVRPDSTDVSYVRVTKVQH